MNREQLSYTWKQVKAHVKSEWANIAEEGLMHLRAKKDMFVGKIQERYTNLKDETERQLEDIIFQAEQRDSGRFVVSEGARPDEEADSLLPPNQKEAGNSRAA
jgi:uncharacterized protein YjbJ (UPF0337 family)